MLAYAMREFELNARQEDGLPLRAHLDSLARQTGVVPEGFEPIPCPEELRHLWEYFVSMSARRTSNGFGPNPITDEGVEAWARRRRVTLTAVENAALDALENAYLGSAAKQAKVK